MNNKWEYFVILDFCPAACLVSQTHLQLILETTEQEIKISKVDLLFFYKSSLLSFAINQNTHQIQHNKLKNHVSLSKL